MCFDCYRWNKGTNFVVRLFYFHLILLELLNIEGVEQINKQERLAFNT